MQGTSAACSDWSLIEEIDYSGDYREKEGRFFTPLFDLTSFSVGVFTLISHSSPVWSDDAVELLLSFGFSASVSLNEEELEERPIKELNNLVTCISEGFFWRTAVRCDLSVRTSRNNAVIVSSTPSRSSAAESSAKWQLFCNASAWPSSTRTFLKF